MHKLSVSTKIIGLLFIVGTVLAAVSLYQTSRIRYIDDLYSALLSRDVENVMAIDDVATNSDRIGHLLYRMIAQSAVDDMKKTETDLVATFGGTDKLLAKLSEALPAKQAEIAALRQQLTQVTAASEPVRRATLASDNATSLREAETGFTPRLQAFDAGTETLRQWLKMRLDEQNSGTTDITNATVLTAYIVLGLCFALSLLLGWFVSRTQIVAPVVRLTTAMQAVARGEAGVTVPGTGRGDELGGMARAFQENASRIARLAEEDKIREAAAAAERRRAMTEMATDFERSVGGIVQTVSTAANQLAQAAQTLSSTAEETTNQSSAVADAATEASANVETVAAAAEELSASIAEISRQVTESVQVTGNVVQTTEVTAAKVRELTGAAEKIGAVVDLINNIAGQTNLLALNATIEAARAGDAGRGFAVVASEVKQLADQTARATSEIAAQISAIQTSTQESASAIVGVTEAIGRLNRIGGSIAAAVDQQTGATREIARNVQQAALGTGSVSSNIVGVTQASASASAASAQVLASARDLTEQAQDLRTKVADFLATVRAA